ncbi:MAG: hypothetical protein ACI33P_10330 [Lysinibacillus sp.]
MCGCLQLVLSALLPVPENFPAVAGMLAVVAGTKKGRKVAHRSGALGGLMLVAPNMLSDMSVFMKTDGAAGYAGA